MPTAYHKGEMMGCLGTLTRLRRLQNQESGRILTVAIDHAPSYGVLEGLEEVRAVVDTVAEAGPDAIMVMKGTAEGCYERHAGRIPLILKVSTLSPFHPERDVWITHMEQAHRLGADAVAMAVTVGSPEQSEILRDLANLIREAEQTGMPVIVHAYPNGSLVPEEECYSAERVGYAARLAAEVGADIVKTFYTGTAATFAEVVRQASPAIVVAAGGARLNTPEEVYAMASQVVSAGAGGITFGRNVWQSADPVAMITRLKEIVHGENA